jgi:hypothetical protein
VPDWPLSTAHAAALLDERAAARSSSSERTTFSGILRRFFDRLGMSGTGPVGLDSMPSVVPEGSERTIARSVTDLILCLSAPPCPNPESVEDSGYSYP